MFTQTQPNVTFTPPARPPASEVARIQGGGLTQLIITEAAPLSFHLYQNDHFVPQESIESLSILIEAAGDGNPRNGTVRAALACRPHTNSETVETTGKGARKRADSRPSGALDSRDGAQGALFPGTFQLLALGRIITVTCLNPGSLEGLWISLGMRPNGTTTEVCGAKALRIFLSEGRLEAQLTWEDGTVEELLPRP